MSLRLMTGRATAGVRRLVARHRWTRWIPVAACSAGLVVTTQAYLAGAEAAREGWGERRSVWIADRDVDPGHEIDARRAELPRAAVPDAAIASDATVAGRVARQRIHAGEVLTASDVAGVGRVSLLPEGWRGVAVTESPPSGASVGDRVDVVSDGEVIAAGAIVLDQLNGAVLVGAPRDLAPLIALADASGVTLLRTGSVGPP